ncbi:hypothetical protein [Corynebacterium urealyticum]|uniref:hypothetical protein n=1 Tax=Corynebacterium urealyticum TaxID=43771 RepID=UPI0021CCF615|nr:hypothetical protein [Corynebacterium urealyticum]
MMSAPLLEPLSKDAAEKELAELERSLDGGLAEFESRAYSYNLTPREFAKWERITELRWLLGLE